jgi:hypothetical protein
MLVKLIDVNLVVNTTQIIYIELVDCALIIKYSNGSWTTINRETTEQAEELFHKTNQLLYNLGEIK